MTTQAYPLRIQKEILDIARLRAQEQHTDQSTALRQLLYIGTEEYILSMVEQGRISGSRAAEMLGISLWDLFRFAELHGVRLGATPEQQRKSMATTRKVLK